jgi:hypothetical protein
VVGGVVWWWDDLLKGVTLIVCHRSGSFALAALSCC